MTDEPWKCEVEDTRKISLETAKVFFHQAEKRLETTNTANREIESKAFNLLSILVPILVALVAFIISPLSQDLLCIKVVTSAMVLFSTVPIFHLIGVVFPKVENFAGSEPKELMVSELILLEDEEFPDIQTVSTLFSECHSYQHRIEENQNTNETIGEKLKTAVTLCISMPFLACLIYYACQWLYRY